MTCSPSCRKKFHHKEDDHALKVDVRTAAAALVTVMLVVLLIGYVIGENARDISRTAAHEDSAPNEDSALPDSTEAIENEDASMKDGVNHDSTSTERGQIIHEW
ncbi:hypothetical protein MRX96_017853 [Rhipicephalus microplus]